MQIWQDGLVALLASVGLASIMWTLVRAVLFAGPEVRRELAVLLPVQGDGGSWRSRSAPCRPCAGSAA